MGTRIQVAVNIVFDQGYVVFFGQLQHAVHVRQRGRCPGGAVQPRLGEEHFGAVRLQQMLQQGQVIAFWGAGHPQQVSPQQAQTKAQVGIAGIIDQHRIAGMDQPPGNQIQRVAGALGEQNLFGGQRHLLLGQQVAHQLAQRHKALGLAIAADADLA